MPCTQNIQTHNMWPCFLCHISFMQTALNFSHHILSLLSTHSVEPSSPAVKIYWCPLMLSVPGFLPGNSYYQCFWMQEKTPAGHLVKSPGHWQLTNLPYHVMARWTMGVFVSKGSYFFLLTFTFQFLPYSLHYCKIQYTSICVPRMCRNQSSFCQNALDFTSSFSSWSV